MSLLFKNLLFTFLVPGTVAGFVPWWIVQDGADDTHFGWRVGSVVPFTVGIAIYAWCVWDFATFGRGTPAPIDAPKRLVVRGLYAVVRNPMYVGVLAVILGWATMFASVVVLGYGAVVFSVFHSFIVFHEEPSLRRAFGLEYERYTGNVHRWLPRRCHEPTVLRVADDVFCFHRREYLSCSYAILRGDQVVLVDTGIDTRARDVESGLGKLGRTIGDVRAVLLTHWHNDHSSGAARIERESGAPVYCHADAVGRMTRTDRAGGIRGWIARQLPAVGWLSHVRGLLELAPLHPVRDPSPIAEGDTIEGLEVLETPGHEDGHVSFYCAKHRILFAGDALAVADDRVSFMSRVLTKDVVAAKDSMLRCLDVGAEILCPGHRYPLLTLGREEIESARKKIDGMRRWPLFGC